MDPTTLMLRDLYELRISIENPDLYVVLRSAAVIRRLILDKTHLLGQVNRQLRAQDSSLRIKAIFRIAEPTELKLPPDCPPPTILCPLDGIYPADAEPESKILELTRDNFLSFPLIKIHGTTISIHKLVDFLANKEGAVHLGEPDDIEQAHIRMLNQSFGVGGLPAATMHLRAISKIVIDALAPFACAALRQRLQTCQDAVLSPHEYQYSRLLFQQAHQEKDETLCIAFALALCRLAVIIPSEMVNLSNAVWLTTKHLGWLPPEKQEIVMRRALLILESAPRDSWQNELHFDLALSILEASWIFYAAKSGEIDAVERLLRKIRQLWLTNGEGMAVVLSCACENTIHGDSNSSVTPLAIEISRELLGREVLAEPYRTSLMQALGSAEIASTNEAGNK